jgi:hypothetical protein
MPRGEAVLHQELPLALLPFQKLDVWYSFKFGLDALGVMTWFGKIVTRRNNKATGLNSVIRLKSQSARENSEGLGVQEEAK